MRMVRASKTVRVTALSDPAYDALNRAAAAIPTRVLMRRLLREHVAGYWKRIALAMVMMVLVAASTASLAKLMEPVLDQVFTQKNSAMLREVAVVILVAFMIKGASAYGHGVLMNHVGQRIVADLQIRLFEHLLRADLALYHATTVGSLITRFTSDATMLRGAVSNAITGLGKDILTLFALVGVMFWQDWKLALIAFVAFPTAVLPILRLGKRMRKVASNTQDQQGVLTALLDRAFAGARHVKAYRAEDVEAGRAQVTINRLFELQHKSGKVRAASHPIMETLGGLAIVAVIVYGGGQVIDGARTTGAFFSFITALLLAYEPVKRLANLNTSLQEGMAAAQRLYAALDIKPRIIDAAGATVLKTPSGEIVFDQVHFSYRPDRPALKSLSLTAPAGKTVALVGPSGAGKSTLLNLIMRFYDVTDGAIRIDGQDIRSVTIDSLRRAIGLVSQEIFLFDDSVRANIAYGAPNATEAEIEAAAKGAAAHDFIMALPQGYDTVVGEQGVKLSGGQRQRVAIARAMLKDAPILLLDEATSALDTESERQVQTALKRLMQGRTSLVIAHRLSTIVDADLIFVIEGGRVVESGDHDTLLAQGGAYARLYRLQFADQAAEQVA
jgi:subfamily B ATP-binding cassette protein MsbA